MFVRTAFRNGFGKLTGRCEKRWRVAFAVTGELGSQYLNIEKGARLQTNDKLWHHSQVDRARVLQPSMQRVRRSVGEIHPEAVVREEEWRSVLFDLEASPKERWSEEPALAQDDVALVCIRHLVLPDRDWIWVGYNVGEDFLAYLLRESEESGGTAWRTRV